ncbi:MAG TPA: DNA ligase D [Fimbriimonas sp.]|nr:DNA ligase D [Fimbriimonas sp.]
MATFSDEVPEGDQWLHEIKFDGYRLLAWKIDNQVHLMTRGGLDWTEKFPTVAKAVHELLPDRSGIDGEVTVFDEAMISRFDRLQKWIESGEGPNPTCMAFDLIWYEGKDLTSVPLVDRKAMLKTLIDSSQNLSIAFSSHVLGNNSGILKEACRQGLEGIISKKLDAPYVQSRTHTWIKSKCVQQEEFVIGGYTAPGGARTGFGALLLGQFNAQGVLEYVGKVGTGFDDRLLSSLYEKMKKGKSPRSPFPPGASVPSVESWVKPRLVAQVRYATKTDSGMLRHAVFVGLREDKLAKDVHPEEAMEKLPVNITHPERILFPDSGVTKLALAEYYNLVAEKMMPWVNDRPLAIVSCPDGVANACFFQKHAGAGMPESVSKLARGEDEPFLTVSTKEDLLSMAQFGAVEFHAWASTFKNLEKPDVMVLDLDPGPGVKWKRVIEAAQVTGEYIRSLGITPFVKLSGGKGIHVVIPVKPGSLDWAQFKSFSHALAKNLDEMVPGQFVTVATKAKRQNRIYIDYLRNGRGATAIVPYSVRTTPEASVSVPLRWEELNQIEDPRQFTVSTVQEWISDFEKDPWEEFFSSATQVSSKMLIEVGLGETNPQW